MAERAEFARQRIDALAARLGPVRHILDRGELCVYATGSYGRLEAGEHSDIDLFFLHDAAGDGDFPYLDLVRVMACLVDAADDLGFPPFSGDGRYLTVQSVSRVEQVLGSPDDDQLNTFTARLLLLLESRPLTDPERYDQLLRRIIGFYYRDFADHRGQFVPTFLLNDILRFWRTLTLNYEHHRLKLVSLVGEDLERKKADSALKNYKLKISRLTTCFSMAAHLGASPAPVTLDRVVELCRQTPWDRLEALRSFDGSADVVVTDLRTRYDAFLEVTQRPEADAVAVFLDGARRRELLEEARAYGDQIFQLVRVVTPPKRFRYFVV